MTTRYSKRIKNKRKHRDIPEVDDSDDLPKDISHLSIPIPTSILGLEGVVDLFQTATEDVKQYLSNECEILYECRICKSIFRSLANFIRHKKQFCTESFKKTHIHCCCYNNQIYNKVINQRTTIHSDLTKNINLFKMCEKMLNKEDDAHVNDKCLQPDNCTVNYSEQEIPLETLESQVIDLDNIVMPVEVTTNNNLVTRKSAELTCKKCKENFCSEQVLSLHYKSRHKTDYIVYSCPECDFYFITPWGTFKHLLSKHKKTQEDIRVMREKIFNNGILKSVAEKNALSNRASSKSTKTNDDENQEWLLNLENDRDLQMCGGCGVHFERKAALNAHFATCSKRKAVCDRKNTKNVQIICRIPLNKEDTEASKDKQDKSNKTINTTSPNICPVETDIPDNSFESMMDLSGITTKSFALAKEKMDAPNISIKTRSSKRFRHVNSKPKNFQNNNNADIKNGQISRICDKLSKRLEERVVGTIRSDTIDTVRIDTKTSVQTGIARHSSEEGFIPEFTSTPNENEDNKPIEIDDDCNSSDVLSDLVINDNTSTKSDQSLNINFEHSYAHIKQMYMGEDDSSECEEDAQESVTLINQYLAESNNKTYEEEIISDGINVQDSVIIDIDDYNNSIIETEIKIEDNKIIDYNKKVRYADITHDIWNSDMLTSELDFPRETNESNLGEVCILLLDSNLKSDDSDTDYDLSKDFSNNLQISEPTFLKCDLETNLIKMLSLNLKCPSCDMGFSGLCTLLEHVKEHPKLVYYQCTQCFFISADKHLSKLHVNTQEEQSNHTVLPIPKWKVQDALNKVLKVIQTHNIDHSYNQVDDSNIDSIDGPSNLTQYVEDLHLKEFIFNVILGPQESMKLIKSVNNTNDSSTRPIRVRNKCLRSDFIYQPLVKKKKTLVNEEVTNNNSNCNKIKFKIKKKIRKKFL